MYLLLPVFLLFAAYLIGNLVKKLLRDPEAMLPEAVLTGTMTLLLLWEFLVLPAIKLLSSFLVVSRIYSGLLLTVFVLSIVLCGKEIRKQWMGFSVRFSLPLAAAVILFFVQLFFFFSLKPDLSGDFTVETVNTTLQSDLIYENHPGMGDTFVYGITFRGKLVSLPLFYAYLDRLISGELAFFGRTVLLGNTAASGRTAALVYRAMPIWCLMLSYMAYGLLAEVFFCKMEKREKRMELFFIGLGILNIFGSMSEDSIFYYQIFRGFRGETFVFSILLPYTIYLCWQIYCNKKRCCVIYLIMTGVTTLILTDCQKGLVPYGIAVLLCSLIAIGYKMRRWLHCRS